jgi:hypothetical protein
MPIQETEAKDGPFQYKGMHLLHTSNDMHSLFLGTGTMGFSRTLIRTLVLESLGDIQRLTLDPFFVILLIPGGSTDQKMTIVLPVNTTLRLAVISRHHLHIQTSGRPSEIPEDLEIPDGL